MTSNKAYLSSITVTDIIILSFTHKMAVKTGLVENNV